jgi:hypothetical protein
MLGPPTAGTGDPVCAVRLVASGPAEAAKWNTFRRVFEERGYDTAIGPAVGDAARAELGLRPGRRKCVGTLAIRWAAIDSNGDPMATVDTLEGSARGRGACEKVRVELLGQLWTQLRRCASGK